MSGGYRLTDSTSCVEMAEIARAESPGTESGPPTATPDLEGKAEVAIAVPKANGRAEADRPLMGGDGGEGDRGGRPLSPPLRRCFWLAVCSVVFGCSCVGIVALVNAVKAMENEKRGDEEKAQRCQKRAEWCSIASFGACVVSVLLALALIVLVSYLVRLAH
ncbi:interferon-induced transmembrane protein 5-like [Heptranchias perlo]|uniref:interferon-induced transmembrane protein 5-like n=1 Tax=Heptranchias perlo TaxID=212740 RepID=UPI00355A1398